MTNAYMCIRQQRCSSYGSCSPGVSLACPRSCPQDVCIQADGERVMFSFYEFAFTMEYDNDDSSGDFAFSEVVTVRLSCL